MSDKDNLLHFGTKRHSGRYPWGSGEDPYQSASGLGFLHDYDTYKNKGMSQKEIAEKMGMNTTQLRDRITWAERERKDFLKKQIATLHESGMSKTMIGQKLGVSEATVRNYISKKDLQPEKIQLDTVTDAIKQGYEQTGYLDVGVGVERQLGVSRTKFNTAVNKLVEEEGYNIHQIYVKRLSDPTGKSWTTVKVLTKEPDIEVVKANSDKIKNLNTQSDDNGMSLTTIKPPKMLDLDRIKIRYAEDGGEDKDGLIELRRGVDDLDLGANKYAQVRIGAGDNLYLKGMAAYTDADFPKGVDIIFNTNKSKDVSKEKVLKSMTDDPDNPFGTTITKQKGALNIVNEEGDWDTWSTKMSSQFLSKQPVSLVKDRLEATFKTLDDEYNEIISLTNPVVKEFLLTKYNEGLDSKAKQLKAQGLPNTKNHVLLPVPDLKPNEIFAPNYPDGERVVLVRHPHGGKFEIPDLVVNNKNAVARKMIGSDSVDAVGIHPTVASKLSGADFDGDTALVIPNNNGAIKTSRSLAELKNFQPSQYKVTDPDSPRFIRVKDKKTGEIINTGKTIQSEMKQTQMGIVSNLITDMTIKGASDSELARAVKHSMVVIDSEKHNLDYKQSAIDNGISALRRKYQTSINPDTGKKTQGASTLISRSKNKVDISDPNFNPDKLSSGTPVEQVYSNYIKNVQAIKNKSSKALTSIKYNDYNKDAAVKYKSEVESLNNKLNTALLNAPKERQAQILTNNLYYKNIAPDMSNAEKKKLKSRALATARVKTGANKKDVNVEVTDKEWEAIQAGAISSTKLKTILDNTDMDRIKQLASPRETKLSTAKATRAQSMLNNGYTYAEIASSLGVSTSEIRSLINRGD